MSYGLGFFELFQLAEDFGAEPLPIVNCGLHCQFAAWDQHGKDDLAYLDAYVQDALDLVEFACGDATTTWGRVRAEMGHPQPFGVKMIQIGNENWGEDFLWNFDTIAQAVKAKWPQIEVIGSAGGGVDNDGWRLAMKHYAGRSDFTLDEHYYQPADWFYRNASRYDAYDRKGPRIFVGEYASFDRVNGKARICFDNALGEAALMTGFERNCDVVVKAAFAPMFMRCVEGTKKFFNDRKYSSEAWSGAMLWFDGLDVIGRSSYYVQKMFALNRPDVIVPHAQDVPQTREGVFAVCGLDRAKGEIVVKVVNPGAARKLTLDFAAALPAGKVSVETLACDDLYAENSLAESGKVMPMSATVAFAGGKTLEHELPAHSLAVLRLTVR